MPPAWGISITRPSSAPWRRIATRPPARETPAPAASANSRRHLDPGPPEGLEPPVGQAPPQPFERAEQEVAQPQRADDQLQHPDGEDDEVDLVEVQLREVV